APVGRLVVGIVGALPFCEDALGFGFDLVRVDLVVELFGLVIQFGKDTVEFHDTMLPQVLVVPIEQGWRGMFDANDHGVAPSHVCVAATLCSRQASGATLGRVGSCRVWS